MSATVLDGSVQPSVWCLVNTRGQVFRVRFDNSANNRGEACLFTPSVPGLSRVQNDELNAAFRNGQPLPFGLRVELRRLGGEAL